MGVGRAELLRVQDQRGILVGMAKCQDARQQHGFAAGFDEERLAQGSRGAPRR